MTIRRVTLALLLVLDYGCARQPARKAFTLATTTSVENSGLLNHLHERFRGETGIEIQPLVVGSGKALRLARDGRVQVILTHDPRGERAFVASGRAALYRQFARNDFIVVGPPNNPAALQAIDTVLEAFRKIHASASSFVSRGDESGTHSRELEIWARLHIDPQANPSYRPLGQSMSALLRSADELSAYTLADRATFEQLRTGLDLRVYVDRGADLANIYSVTLVKSDDPELQYASRFVKWLLSARGREAIESFHIHGRQAFTVVGSPSP